MFRKVMQISDDLMYRYYELLTDMTAAEISALRDKINNGQHYPMEAKAELAARIVTDFHSADESGKAREVFRRVVQQGQVPDDIRTFPLPEGVRGKTTIRIDKLLREIGLASSGGEANRKLREGAVSINGEKHREMSYDLDPSQADFTIQLGKEWAKVKL